jgi:DNA invertase Pin-like site-specific DNA recombinase
MKGIIYCVTSPSKKKYYGYSSLSLEDRKTKHRKGKTLQEEMIQKYGVEEGIKNIIFGLII